MKYKKKNQTLTAKGHNGFYEGFMTREALLTRNRYLEGEVKRLQPLADVGQRLISLYADINDYLGPK